MDARSPEESLRCDVTCGYASLNSSGNLSPIIVTMGKNNSIKCQCFFMKQVFFHDYNFVFDNQYGNSGSQNFMGSVLLNSFLCRRIIKSYANSNRSGYKTDVDHLGITVGYFTDVNHWLL